MYEVPYHVAAMHNEARRNLQRQRRQSIEAALIDATSPKSAPATKDRSKAKAGRKANTARRRAR
jgi:hypothetical protein